MSRLRLLATVTLLAGTAVLMPASAASAATPLKASIVCDGQTGAITTSASGTLLQPGARRPVVVEFQRRSGRNIALGATAFLQPLATPFRTTVMSTLAGGVSANGYTNTFTPATSLYYREAIVVTFKSLTGQVYATRQATCERDLRTTVTVTCDPAAGTVTATVLGRDGQAGGAAGHGRATSVGYRTVTISQSTADGVRWRQEPLIDFDFKHRVTPAADGTWSDTGFTHTISNSPYFYAEEVTVGVFNQSGDLVGGGSGTCTLFDGSVTPARG
jgi:hypothetical protein